MPIYSDPGARFVMVAIQIDGPGAPFHLRMTVDEYEAMMTRSRRQYEEGRAWPPGRHWRPADDPRESRFRREWGEPSFTNPPPSYSFFFTAGESPFEESFNKRYEEARKKQEEHDRQQKAKAKAKEEPPLTDTAARMALARLAGVEWPTDIPNKNLYTRATRRCHPDVPGGSKKKWEELEKVARHLRLINSKGAPVR